MGLGWNSWDFLTVWKIHSVLSPALSFKSSLSMRKQPIHSHQYNLQLLIWSGSSGLGLVAGIADWGELEFLSDWFTWVLTGRWPMMCSIQNDVLVHVCTFVYLTWVSVRESKSHLRCSLHKGPYCNSQDLPWGSRDTIWKLVSVKAVSQRRDPPQLSHEMAQFQPQIHLCVVF